jgi:hypothetical protein
VRVCTQYDFSHTIYKKQYMHRVSRWAPMPLITQRAVRIRFFRLPFTFIQYLPHFARRTLTNDTRALDRNARELRGKYHIYIYIYIHTYVCDVHTRWVRSVVNCTAEKNNFSSKNNSCSRAAQRLRFFFLPHRLLTFHITMPFKHYGPRRPFKTCNTPWINP